MSVVHWLKDVFENKRRIAEGKKQAAAVAHEFRDIDRQLLFANSDPLTLGVEFELALIDPATLKPAPVADEVMNELNRPGLRKELFRHMVEMTTPEICRDTHEIGAQMSASLEALLEAADKRGLLVTGTGRPPSILLADCQRIEDARYDYLEEGRKVLNQRFGTLGMHIHIGMESAEKCIRYHNFYMHFLPHMIALAASSPFEDGVDTGLASIRPTIAESLPVAGMPYSFGTWQEYVALCHAMYRAGSIRNLKDLWWDLRPSPKFGTLELRVCDQLSNLGEALAIVSFVHALGRWFEDNQSWLDEMPRPSGWRLRENKWRAMRYGVAAQLVVNKQGDTQAVADDIRKWLDRIQPQYERMNYHAHRETLLKMLANGNSAARQQKLWAATGSIADVTKFNCRELRNGMPLWSELERIVAAAAPPQPTDAKKSA
jgi:carboxylate-amine ligase